MAIDTNCCKSGSSKIYTSEWFYDGSLLPNLDIRPDDDGNVVLSKIEAKLLTFSPMNIIPGAGINVSQIGNNVTITNASPNTNQSITLAGNILTLSAGGGSVTLPNSSTAQVQSNWTEVNVSSPSYILNKPSVPVAQGFQLVGNDLSLIDGGLTTITLPSPAYTGSTSIILTGNSFQRAALTGDVTSAANSNTTTIAANAVTSSKIIDEAVTFAKMQTIPSGTLLGRSSGITPNPGVVTSITIGTGLSLTGGILAATTSPAVNIGNTDLSVTPTTANRTLTYGATGAFTINGTAANSATLALTPTTSSWNLAGTTVNLSLSSAGVSMASQGQVATFKTSYLVAPKIFNFPNITAGTGTLVTSINGVFADVTGNVPISTVDTNIATNNLVIAPSTLRTLNMGLGSRWTITAGTTPDQSAIDISEGKIDILSKTGTALGRITPNSTGIVEIAASTTTTSPQVTSLSTSQLTVPRNFNFPNASGTPVMSVNGTTPAIDGEVTLPLALTVYSTITGNDYAEVNPAVSAEFPSGPEGFYTPSLATRTLVVGFPTASTLAAHNIAATDALTILNLNATNPSIVLPVANSYRGVIIDIKVKNSGAGTSVDFATTPFWNGVDEIIKVSGLTVWKYLSLKSINIAGTWRWELIDYAVLPTLAEISA